MSLVFVRVVTLPPVSLAFVRFATLPLVSLVFVRVVTLPPVSLAFVRFATLPFVTLSLVGFVSFPFVSLSFAAPVSLSLVSFASLVPALRSRRTSPDFSSRYRPILMPRSVIPAISTRLRRRTLQPSAVSIRRICRLRPSEMRISSRLRVGARRSTLIFTPCVRRPATYTPALSLSMSSVANAPAISTTYVFSTPCFGCVMICVNSPSLVRMISPVLSTSRRPTQ